MSAFSSLSEFWQTMLPFIMLVEIVLEIGLFMLDFSVDTIKLLKVANTDEITKVTAEIYGTKTFLPENQKPFTKKIKKKLTLQRARNPEKRKTDGDFFTEKECPSCGANFLPDENGCCSYCGYTLHEDSIKWKIKS